MRERVGDPIRLAGFWLVGGLGPALLDDLRDPVGGRGCAKLIELGAEPDHEPEAVRECERDREWRSRRL